MKENEQMLEIGRRGIVNTRSPLRRRLHKAIPTINVLDVLHDNIWQGSPCFIIGGGESIKDQKIDLSRLQGHLTIAINKSFMTEAFDPTIIYSMDGRFWMWVEKGTLGNDVLDKFLKSEALKVWLFNKDVPLPPDIFRVANSGPRVWGNSLREGIGGTHSGFGALNLAIHLGASPVYLLGYDMKGKNGKQTWWHGKYPTIQAESVFLNYKKLIEAHAANCKGRVVNLNPDSALKCFKFASFNDIPKPKTYPRIICYYTVNMPYEKEIMSLRLSLRSLGLKHSIVGVEGQGSWERNCAHKPSFILEQIYKYPGEPLLYVDADAIFERRPDYFETLPITTSIMPFFRQRQNPPRKELVSFTIYVPPTEKAKHQIELWQAEQMKDWTIWDQRVLQKVIEENPTLFDDMKSLPPEYGQIFDAAEQISNPVIVQYQASRRFKKLI